MQHIIFLLISSIKDAKKIIDECQADGKTNYTFEPKNKKIGEMTRIIYDEELKMLRQHLFKEEEIFYCKLFKFVI